jgi:hypothetical protein
MLNLVLGFVALCVALVLFKLALRKEEMSVGSSALNGNLMLGSG